MNSFIENLPATQELETPELHEAILSAQQVTVEFGTGDMPLFEIQDTHAFNTQNLYIGVNIDSKQHEFLAEKIKEVSGFAVLNEKNKDGSIDRLPIADGSVDTVFMANVFGEPDSQLIMEPFKNSDGLYKGNTDISSKIETLNEAKRLLKQTGRIVILENNTPYKGGLSGKYDSMIELLENGGFRIVDAVNQKDDGWVEIVAHFAKPEGWWSDGSYLVIAEKDE